MNIIIYTTPACPYCIIIKNFLKKNNIKFEEVDISKNEKKKEELIKKSGQMSVPVTEIDGKIIIGYQIDKIKEVLGIE